MEFLNSLNTEPFYKSRPGIPAFVYYIVDLMIDIVISRLKLWRKSGRYKCFKMFNLYLD